MRVYLMQLLRSLKEEHDNIWPYGLPIFLAIFVFQKEHSFGLTAVAVGGYFGIVLLIILFNWSIRFLWRITDTRKPK